MMKSPYSTHVIAMICATKGYLHVHAHVNMSFCTLYYW